MKACTVVPGQPDSAALTDVDPPAPNEGDILVDALAVGVCGTDVEIVRFGYGTPPPGSSRLTIFHESLGRVAQAPSGASVSAGDLVVGVVRRPDPVPCTPCSKGEWDFCRNGRYTERGIKGLPGYGSEQWRVTEEFVIRLDPALGDLGVLTEPTSVVAKAWDQTERIASRSAAQLHRVLVTGAGPIGLLAAMIGVQKGYEVHVLDQVRDGPKPRLVKDLGGSYHAAVTELNVEPDIVIECTGIGQLVFDVIGRTAPDAVVCLTGLSSGSRAISADADAINKQLVLGNDVVFGSVNANRRHYELAAGYLAAADQEWLSRLITRRVPAGRWPDALDRQGDDVKVVVDLKE